MKSNMIEEPTKKTGQYKSTEVGLIPYDWNVNSIGDLFKFKQGIQVPVEKQFPTDSNNRVRFIRIVDVTQNDEPPRFIDNPGQGHLIQKGNLFMVRYGAAGVVSNSFEGVIANNLFRLMSVENIDSNYFLYLLRYKYLDIVALSSSTTMSALNFGSLRELKLQTPSSISEQTAIAEALSDADAMIASLEKLIEKKKKIKQGAMQELLRPKEGWVKKKFNEIFLKYPTKAYQINSSNYKESGHYPIIDQGKRPVVGYTDDQSKVFQCPKDGIIVFGDHTRILKYVDYDFVVGADGTQIISTSNGCSNLFAFYLLLTKDIPNTGYNRHFKYLFDFDYVIPSSQDEQVRIADILKSIDEEISLLDLKLEKQKLQKQGMMQKLLTGKIRLV
jgi:type I restriction enzyme S subunit